MLDDAGQKGRRALGGVVVGVPAGLAEAVSVLLDVGEDRGHRRVWARSGRAHIEVRGLDGRGERHERLAREVTGALRGVEGVAWAEVNAALGQVVVGAEEDCLDVDALLEMVESVEEAHGCGGEPFAGDRPYPPFDTVPAVLAGTSLVADSVGLLVAVVRRVTPLPVFSALLRVPVVVAETQPRVRGMLEGRLGLGHAEMVLGVCHAGAHAATAGIAPLVLDGVQRVWQLAEIRARQAAWYRLERQLVGVAGDGLPGRAPERRPRPVPLPAGPVEKCGERTSLASLLGAAGVAAWARSPEAAVQAILATVPKAAGMGREAFCTQLGRDLARDGVVPMNGAALRLLDRVSAMVIDSEVLCTARPRLLSVAAAGGLDEAAVWAAAQTLLADLPLRRLCGPGPWNDVEGWRLERSADVLQARPDTASGLPLDLRAPDGRYAGRVLVGCDLDPLADAVVTAARSAGRRLLLTEHVSAAELLPWADLTVPFSTPLDEQVRRLQQDGQVVLLIGTADDRALAAADIGVAVLPFPGTAPGGAPGAWWSADLVCSGGTAQVWRILSAVGDACQVSSKSAHLSMGGSTLGALIAAVGARHSVGGLTTSPVYGAAFLAQFGGIRSARRLACRPLPPARVRGAWHALGARETLRVLTSLDKATAGPPAADPAAGIARLLAGAGRAAAVAVGLAPLTRWTGQMLSAVRAELQDPLTPVLALGATASAAVGSSIDAALVGGVMAGNAVVGGAQRLHAERALAGLVLTQDIRARRVVWTPSPVGEGLSAKPLSDRVRFFAGLETAAVHSVAAQELGVGDVIALGPSDVVPADARLLVSDRLEIDEAALTGEPVPVAKDPAATPGAELAERSCMVYEGCTVLSGTGYAVVVATGAQSEAGRAADMAGHAATPPGIEGHLAALTRTVLPAVGIGGAAVTVLGLMRGVPVREALASGVAVAVAAVPEGLPLVATMAQSAAARRLARHGVLTRSARVLEALGRVDVVCFDKTGTLTEGRLTVTRLATPDHDVLVDSPAGQSLLRTAARACPQLTDGGPLAHATDQAVVDAATAQCPPDHAWQPGAELPFEASRGYSASLGTDAGQPCLAVKGAPETVVAHCTTTLGPIQDGPAGIVQLDPTRQQAVHRLVRRLAGDGLRVLAVAQGTPATATHPADQLAELVGRLTLLGFLAIADTPRPGAADTVKRLTEAGVRVVMITGDHPATAAAVACDLGIPQADSVLTGACLDALPEPERIQTIDRTSVFARVSPEHKVRIVQAMQQSGHVVAMTGDGINDAAAIRLADVGIGLAAHGSTSARAAADLVLTDPNPTRILDAVHEGHALWRSVRDAVAILIGGNAGEVAFTVLGTALSGRAPLGTRQLLLVNLLTDMLPALAVALSPARTPQSGGASLASGPTPTLLGPDLARLLAIRGAATTLGAFSAWQIGRRTGLPRRAGTMGLAALITTQLGQTLITDWHSPLVLATAALSAATLITVVQTPGLSHFFGCHPLGPVAWTTVTACATTATLAAAVSPRFLPGLNPKPSVNDTATDGRRARPNPLLNPQTDGP
ncbi:cation-translocating P-type ATPase [Streptomyces shenzhenensis]|uniref:cation-translocating P-type ATPase n=1 Tax=Streptomyces shenzhenensis TaxID=943815 RepID=UPI00217F155C|nr:cation-translocating P-type ATPase [Streptomyces shenzhenensis]